MISTVARQCLHVQSYDQAWCCDMVSRCCSCVSCCADGTAQWSVASHQLQGMQLCHPCCCALIDAPRAADQLFYKESKKFQLSVLPQLCKLPGSYRVTFSARHAAWINQPLVWEFKVRGGDAGGQGLEACEQAQAVRLCCAALNWPVECCAVLQRNMFCSAAPAPCITPCVTSWSKLGRYVLVGYCDAAGPIAA
jgi:hypothetical protein